MVESLKCSPNRGVAGEGGRLQEQSLTPEPTAQVLKPLLGGGDPKPPAAKNQKLLRKKKNFFRGFLNPLKLIRKKRKESS